MKQKQKIQIVLFALILISMFLDWEHTNLYEKDNSISAINILNLAHYWPFYLGLLSPIAGIYFTIKSNQKYIFVSGIVSLVVAIIFYFQIVPITNRAFSSSDEFKKVLQDSLSIGFYLFAIASLIISGLTIKDSGIFDNNILKNKNDDIITKTEKSVQTINESNKETIAKPIKISTIGLIIILILLALAGSCFYYFKVYKPKKESDEIVSKVKVLLKKYHYVDMSQATIYEGSSAKIVTFNENLATFIYRRMISISETNDETEKLPYKIILRDSSSINLEFTSPKGEIINYEFTQTELGQTVLAGKFNFLAYDDNNNVVSNLSDIIDPKLKLRAITKIHEDSIKAVSDAKKLEIEKIRILNDTFPAIFNSTLKMYTVICDTLEVMKNDLGSMGWNQAMASCNNLGNGWHLPTMDELNILCINQTKIKGFVADSYWSSTDGGQGNAVVQNFENSSQQYCDYKGDLNTNNVRAVRNIRHPGNNTSGSNDSTIARYGN